MPDRQSQTPFLDALKARGRSDHAPFYTPGHKRGQGASPALIELLGKSLFQLDLPELPDLDNLFAPQGPILAAQELAAAAFGADRTWFLTNGSTCGIVAAILATCGPGDRLLLPRNVHQSAIAGLILSGALPGFIAPEYDPVLDLVHSITPAGVAAALEQYPDAKAVLLVYPTYYGVCGDGEAIAHLTHQHGIPLLVDEAHGPHFAFHPALPTSALAAGADLSVQSTHKVLSALSQAAMLHVRGDRLDQEQLSWALQLVQSTSPNSLLLASLDAARHQMATQGQALMAQVLELAEQARLQISQIPQLSLLTCHRPTPGFCALDPTRLTVTVSGLGLSGFAADEILDQSLGVTAELPSLRHLTFILSLGNTAKDIERLVQGLTTLALRRGDGFPIAASAPEIPLASLSPREAFFAPAETLPLEQAVGRISAELICPYPPGIPVLLPGEAIAPTALTYLQQVLAAGGMISGCADPSLKTLRVVRSDRRIQQGKVDR